MWILYLQESPFLTYSFEPKDVFNWTATYRRDSDIPIPYGRWVYYDERVKQNAKLDHNYAANKTKKASCSIALLLSIIRYRNILRSSFCKASPSTQNAVCLSGLGSLSAAECYILSRLF